MDNPVIIKGNKTGIVLVLDNTVDFDVIINSLKDKLKSAGNHYSKNLQFALTIENRKLSNPELYQIISIFSQQDITISDIIDDENHNLNKAISNKDISNKDESVHNSKKKFIYENLTMFYYGDLKNGQLLESTNSVVIIGSVLSGATVKSTGSIIIIGSLYGEAFAGCKGRYDTYISALCMQPEKISISDILYSKDKMDSGNSLSYSLPTMAYTEDGNMFMRRI